MNNHQQSFAVIGDPVEHSLSPGLHSIIFDILGQEKQYVAINVKADSLADFIVGSRRSERPGWNVTLPYKTEIIKYLDSIDPLARRIGAVNTVHNKDGHLRGYNTDVAGCIMALRSMEYSNGRKAVILGAGGAARAAVAALDTMGLKYISIFNHSIKRAQLLFDDFKEYGNSQLTIYPWEREQINMAIQDADLLINATPVGLEPHINDSPIDRIDTASSALTVLDMIPGIEVTRIIRQAHAKGCNVVEGLKMLVAQAIAAQEIWQETALTKICYEDILNKLKKDKACLYAY
ncbi:shikimate dehydrogenase [bacterium]|nr:shikimate dehydrogenase [bacterium]